MTSNYLNYHQRWQQQPRMLVKVPDIQTLESMLLFMGIPIDKEEIRQEDVKFPASFMIKGGKDPEIQPINEKWDETR
jgi:hypothetical protein